MRVAERIASRGEGGGWARMFYSVNRGGLYSSASASGTKWRPGTCLWSPSRIAIDAKKSKVGSATEAESASGSLGGNVAFSSKSEQASARPAGAGKGGFRLAFKRRWGGQRIT